MQDSFIDFAGELGPFDGWLPAFLDEYQDHQQLLDDSKILPQFNNFFPSSYL